MHFSFIIINNKSITMDLNNILFKKYHLTEIKLVIFSDT